MPAPARSTSLAASVEVLPTPSPATGGALYRTTPRTTPRSAALTSRTRRYDRHGAHTARGEAGGAELSTFHASTALALPVASEGGMRSLGLMTSSMDSRLAVSAVSAPGPAASVAKDVEALELISRRSLRKLALVGIPEVVALDLGAVEQDRQASPDMKSRLDLDVTDDHPDGVSVVTHSSQKALPRAGDGQGSTPTATLARRLYEDTDSLSMSVSSPVVSPPLMAALSPLREDDEGRGGRREPGRSELGREVKAAGEDARAAPTMTRHGANNYRHCAANLLSGALCRKPNSCIRA